MPDNNVTFATWLQTQFELIPRNVRAATIARLAKLSPGYLSSLRSGIKGKPSADTTEAIARAFAEVRKLNADETRLLRKEGLRFATDVTRRSATVHRLAKLTPPAHLRGFDLMVWRAQNQQCVCGHLM